MKYFLLAISISVISSPALASDLGVSISIGQPGFYGQINLGSHYPRPQVIYPNPVIAIPPAITVQQQPIYLHVPPGHAKKWNKHCYRYNACNQPVYFIQESWYNGVYVPHYQSQSNHFEHYGSGQRRDDYSDNRRKHPERRNEDRSGMNGNYQSDKHEDRGYKKRDKHDQGKGQNRGNQKD
ncbi:hypothetical protein [Nitrosomonas ureae]|uniref:YXWGXW repeat-containing protein n=1 Tax=Nitrosomonas ureae TaxID=44577 RepID=A0A1H5XR53_9PROT|nr:hypothetical protein [Nitrosomonas ureae]SEG13890.1 hypothetical protein SAMN05216334_13023 [Nitrosomonas ureae]